MERSIERVLEIKSPSRDESELIASILAGQTELYHDLIRPYERSVYKMALSFMKNEADAEDVAQEAFLKAFRMLASFRGQAKFSTWLITITLNEARGRLRRPSASRTEALEDAAEVSPALMIDWREVPSDALERKEIRDLLQEALTSLSPIYREVLLLRDVEELSTEETASLLTLTTGAVKVRLHRARLMMQKILAPRLREMNPRKKRFAWF